MKTSKLFLIAVFFLLLASSACNVIPGIGRTIRGSGDVVSEDRDVSGFDRVTLSGYGKLFIEQGETESLTVRTDDNIMPYIETEVKGDTLVLGFTDSHVSIDTSDGIEFDLVVKDLNRIDVSGAGSVEVGDFEAESLTIDLSGAGSLEIGSLTADELIVRQSGAGTVIVSGQVKGQELTHSGVGSYHAGELESQTAIIDISGAGTATLWVTESLDVSISGLGNVIYSGNPRVVQDVSGIGHLVNTDK